MASLGLAGSLLTLQGAGAYDAAVHCASVSAARRIMQHQGSLPNSPRFGPGALPGPGSFVGRPQQAQQLADPRLVRPLPGAGSSRDARAVGSAGGLDEAGARRGHGPNMFQKVCETCLISAVH